MILIYLVLGILVKYKSIQIQLYGFKQLFLFNNPLFA